MRLTPLVFVLACSKTDKPPAPLAPKPTVTVTVDGAPLAIDRAFIQRTSPDVFTVLLGAGKGSCASLLAGTNEPAGQALGFTVTRRVAPTGHEHFIITDLWSRDFDAALATPVEIALAGTADPKTTTKLDVTVDGKVAIRGAFEAQGCGEVQPTGIGVPKVTHPANGSITIAGKRLAIRGVTVQTRPGVAATDLPNITISTNVKDCSAVTLPAPVILERIDTKWSLRGTWFEQPVEGDDAAAGLAFNANAVGKSADGPTLELQLSGRGKIGDYQVELAGTAEAIECVR